MAAAQSWLVHVDDTVCAESNAVRIRRRSRDARASRLIEEVDPTLKFEPMMRRGAALALVVMAVAGICVPAVGQSAKRAPKGIGEFTVPLNRFRGMGDTRFLPNGITKREIRSDEAGKTRRQIGGTNGANVLEQVVDALPTPSTDQRTPFTTADEQFIFFAGSVAAGGKYQLHRLSAGAVNNPAQPGSATPIAITNEPGADHLFPVLDAGGTRILFVKSTDNEPVGSSSKVWHLYTSRVPSSGTISTTSPGTTELVPLTLGRSFRGKAFASAGRACWIGPSDVVFSGRLQGEPANHLFSINTTTFTIFQLTDGPADERNPVVSPEGRFLAFDSNAAVSATADTYTGGTTPRSSTSLGDPAIATGLNPSGKRNIFTCGIFGSGVKQFTSRYAGAADTDNVQPAFSSLRQNPYTNATGQNIYLAFASSRQPDVPGAPTAFNDGGTYDIYMVRSSNDEGTTVLSEATPSNIAQGAKLVDTADAGYVYNDQYPTWSPVISMSRVCFQSDRTGNLFVNNYGDGFQSTPDTHDIFLASAVDVSAPTLIRYDTNASTGEIVHINLGDSYVPGQSVRTRENGLLPGSRVFLTVRVDDRESGIDRVFLQFKNPNSYFQAGVQSGSDADRQEHKEYASVGSAPYIFQEGSPPVALRWRNFNSGQSVGVEYEAQVIATDHSRYFGHTASGGPVPIAGSADRGAFSGGSVTILDGQNGRPNCWLELRPLVDANGDPVLPADGRGGVLYGAAWTMPSTASDWYIDAILFDKATNPFGNGRSNWIIYDNIWGCSTALPLNPAEKDILFVSDYTLGQKFFQSRPGQLVGDPDNRQPIQFGAESYYTDSDMGRYPSEQAGSAAQPAPGSTDPRVWSNVGPWTVSALGYSYFRTDPRTGTVVNPGTPHPLGVGSYVDSLLTYTTVTGSNGTRYALPTQGRYSIWRTLSRGPVPGEVLSAYLPGVAIQPADTRAGERQPRTRQVYNRLVVWASPFSGNVFVGPGTITDLTTQQQLASFVDAGGRLLISGQDIGFALAGNGQTNSFFSGTLKARFVADTPGTLVPSLTATGTTLFNTDGWNNGLQHAFGETTDGGTYSYLSAAGRPVLLNTAFQPTTGIGDAALTADQTVGAILDVVGGLAGTTTEFNYTGPGAPGVISSTNPAGGLVIYASMGMESIGHDWYSWTPAGGGVARLANRGTRAKLMANYSMGYRTGQLAGRLIDEQGSPVADALIRAVNGNEALPAAGTAITDSGGFFQIDGLVPGAYGIYGYKPGFYTQHASGIAVPGTGRVTTSLVLKRANPGKLTNIPVDTNGPNPQAAGIFGIDKTTPISGIEIQARRLNPDGRVSVFSTLSRSGFPAGSYELKDLLIGEYEVIVNAPDTFDVNGDLVPNTNYNSSYGTVFLTSSAQPDRFALGTGTTVVDRNGKSVLLIEEDKTAQIDFYLPSAPQPVRGRVIDGATRNGIAGAFVSATTSGTNVVVATATTDADGNYELTTTASPSSDRLPAGNYTVTGSALGYSNNSATVSVAGPNPVVAPDLVLNALPPGSASGYVTGVNGAGVRDATVKFYLVRSGVVSTTATYTATTGTNQVASGYTFNYRLADVAAGDYVVTVERPGLVGDPVQLRVSVTSGNETKRINFRLLPPRVYGDGVQLISLPFNYTGIGTNEIFGLSRTGDNDGDGDLGDAQDIAIFDNFSIADWTGLSYNSGAAVPINTGKGYFVRFGVMTSVTKTGTALPGSSFTITLAPGWNLIGHPFANPINPTVPGADIDLYQQATIVDENNASYTMTQAVQNNLVRGVLFGYSGSNNGSQYFETRVMKAWSGYWFRNATNKSLKLVLQYPEGRSVVNRIAKTITRASLDQPVMRSFPQGSPADWRLQIGVRQGNLIDMDNSVGVGPKASDGFDGLFDNEKPPIVDFAPAVRLHLIGRDIEGRSVALADDIRGSGKSTHQWEFEVSSNSDGQLELVWPGIRLLPRDLEPMLIDPTNGKRIALRSVGSYRIPGSGRATHRLRLEIGRRASMPNAITNLRIVSTRGVGRVLRFNTTRDSDVSISIQTLGGKNVREFGSRSTAGVESSINWDGRDGAGALVPAGTYLVNISATDDGGRVVRQRVPITSVR